MGAKNFDKDEWLRELERFHERTRELHAQGVDRSEAFGLTKLEKRIEQWPPTWGNNLHILVYGDFLPPQDDVAFPALGIHVNVKRREDTIIRDAVTVLDARVSVEDKSLTSVLDAVRRINVFIGVWALTDWAQGYLGWWCHLTHRDGGGVLGKLEPAAIDRAAKGVLELRPDVRQKIDAALYWIRATPRLVGGSHHDAVLQMYADYWNAFECLVDAVVLAVPQPVISRASKQAKIDEFISAHARLTPRDIAKMYHEIVNPGFVEKARYALRVCFPDTSERYVHECFAKDERGDRLYAIRNAINHGSVNAEDPMELIRIEARFSRLWRMVWGMFGQFIPFSYPVDLPESRNPSASR